MQRGRARQYALCTIAVGYDRVSDGVEGVFDQAVTNGLAAIVAHAWPGRERGRRGVLSASDLLTVIEEHGEAAEPGVVHVLHDPAGPKYESAPWGVLNERIANFTTVRATALRGALRATQAIRHARDTGERPDTALTAEQVRALEELDTHPALGSVMEELRDRQEVAVPAADRAEQERATDYLHLLDDQEIERRAALDYTARYRPFHKDDETTVEDCPVCGNVSLVAEHRDGLLGAVGVGQCVVCSYRRTAEAANDQALTQQIQRAVKHPD
ncbi:hypothetical protein AB0C84_35845 [Actinomadura sp. NPDC048955]|uniref:hypothetical protein n=1 Tax=Actinomadura sp. NPDC048955 TaxID=3158228 RepID=UPI0033D7334C